MSTTLLFYKNPVLLDKQKHKNLKLKKFDHLEHAQGVNTVPVAGFEYFPCSRNHPVVFVKNSKGEFISVALLSFTANSHNLGRQWEGVYVPSFVRRYPFVLENSQRMVMFDADAPHLQEDEGDALFDENGEATSTLNDVLAFIESVEQGYKLTETYIQALNAKKLLQPFKGSIKFTDSTLKLDHLYVVDEKTFYGSLSDEEIVDWFKKGWIAWTHAHIHSISAISEVVRRLPKQKPQPV
ncbi:MAG: hypothetical protein ACI9Y1_000865 [Lentisphaeria bacterium]|jgi:hypothetical protein